MKKYESQVQKKHLVLELIFVCVRSDALKCPTLCNPMDCSPPGSSVHAIPQIRILEWAAMPSSRGSSQSKDHVLHLLHCRRILYLFEPAGKPTRINIWGSHKDIWSLKTKIKGGYPERVRRREQGVRRNETMNSIPIFFFNFFKIKAIIRSQ